MNNHYHHRKSFFRSFFKGFSRHLAALFESPDKRDFIRLKKYITS